jgi:hypothetical protein
MPLQLIVDETKTIQMGDDIIVTLEDATTLAGVIRQYDYNNGNLLLETTAPNSLQLVSTYSYFTKVLP